MVEVFKTNVSNRYAADELIAEIQRQYPLYEATFDLDDCDRILRIKCSSRDVHAPHMIDLIKCSGYHAEILEDVLPTSAHHFLTKISIDPSGVRGSR